MITSRYDQGRATVQQMIESCSEEELLLYARDLVLGMNSADSHESRTCTLAMHGLCGTWLEFLRQLE